MELDILHKSSGEYIVEFYGAFFIESCVYYCMEYMDAGSLDKLYGEGVPEDVLAKITISVRLWITVIDEEKTYNGNVDGKGPKILEGWAFYYS